MPPTDLMKKGESGHESVTSLAEPISREESIKEAWEPREKPLCIYEFNIGWKYKGVPIIGLVDEAWFRGGNVDLVVKRKFSSRLEIYSPYHVQAQLYCLGLGEMGFDTSHTTYKIMVFRRSCVDCPKLIDRSCAILAFNTPYFHCEKGAVRVFVYPFNKNKIVEELNWALDYWMGEREAIPTKNHTKCRTCEYHNMCNSSLAK